MPFVRFSRDRRGYEHTYLIHAPSKKGGATKILYWYRTPAGVKVGRSAFDETVRRTLEAQYPGVAFDWQKLSDARIPPVEVEPWRERRRAERAAKQARVAAARDGEAIVIETPGDIETPADVALEIPPELTAFADSLESDPALEMASERAAEDALPEELEAPDEVGIDPESEEPETRDEPALTAAPQSEAPAAHGPARRRRRRGGRRRRRGSNQPPKTPE